MEFAAIFALSVLIGALVVLVAVAVGRQKGELSEQNEMNKGTDTPGKFVPLLPASNFSFVVDFLSLT